MVEETEHFGSWRQKVAKIVHSGLPRGLDAALVSGYANARRGVSGRLGRFSQLLEEIERFSDRGQEKVAKIVHCGDIL